MGIGAPHRVHARITVGRSGILMVLAAAFLHGVAFKLAAPMEARSDALQ